MTRAKEPGSTEGKPRKPKRPGRPNGLRSYCRVCNRYYFFAHHLDTENIQFHQHHGGICQNCGYDCAKIK